LSLFSKQYNLGLFMPHIFRPPNLSRVYAWFSAIIADELELSADLLAHGLPIDVLHPLRHTTALMEATRLGRAGMVQWLIEHGATPTFLSGMPIATPLHCALRQHHWDIAQTLATNMDSCAVMDAYGATPLHTLCSEAINLREGTIILGLATLFIAKNCPLNALDHEGTTALHHCAVNDQIELAVILLRHGANPNASIPDSQVTPLTIAALEKNMPMAELLLQYGANPHARTREGTTPVSIHPPIAKLVTQNFLQANDVLRVDVLPYASVN
jgi:ankyrin repeat protein